jgi:hypothetical protein
MSISNRTLATFIAVALGTPGYKFSFDEHGNSLFNGGPNPYQVVPVAGGGIDYYLPFPVTPGFVLINNSADVTNSNIPGDSDLMTFFNALNNNNQNVGVLRFTSLIDDNDPPDLADVPVLQYLAPVIQIGEIGGEGSDNFQWIPGQPFPAGAEYYGVSDGTLVPEPSTFILLGLGTSGIGLTAYKRRTTRRRPSLGGMSFVHSLFHRGRRNKTENHPSWRNAD